MASFGEFSRLLNRFSVCVSRLLSSNVWPQIDCMKNLINKKLPCQICSNCNHSIIAEVDSCIILRCKECGVAFLNDNKSINAISDLYNDPKYFKHRYFIDPYAIKSKKLLFEECLKNISMLYPNLGKLIDIGSGDGLLLHLAFKKGWDCLGIEISSIGASIASKQYKAKIINKSFENWDSEGLMFDVAILWDLIEHVIDPCEVISKCSKILKPNGVIVIFTPNLNSLIRESANLLSFVFNNQRNKILRNFYPIYHRYYFNKKSLSYLLEKYGFNIVQTKQRNIDFGKARIGKKSFTKLIDALDRFGAFLNKGYRLELYAIRSNEL